MIVGLISAYMEEGRIGRAVRSLLEAGCSKVVVVDGAWTGRDGRMFGGGDRFSTDATAEEAREAGADVVLPDKPFRSDGEKRNLAVHLAGADAGDFLFLLDADEELTGTLRLAECPSGHGMVMLSNLAPNDLPGLRGTWPSGDHSDRPIPLLRWLRWHPTLYCDAPGSYFVEDRQIEPYLVNRMRREATKGGLMLLAYTALREVERELQPHHASVLPIVPGVEILHHGNPAKADAKRAYYEAVA